jgi:hypothetical protein
VQWSPRVATLAPSANTFVPPCGKTQEPRSVNTRLADEGEGEGVLLREREGGRIGAVAATLRLGVDALSHLPVEPQAAANVVRKHRACHRAFRANYTCVRQRPYSLEGKSCIHPRAETLETNKNLVRP